MSFATQLWDKPEVVIKYSQDRRREIEEFIGALNRRIDAEETYAKSVEEAAKVAEKIRQGEESISSLAFSSFKFDCINRGGQSRIFAKSLKQQVLNPLKDLLVIQNQQAKNLQKQSKKLEKELSDLQYQIIKQKGKYDEQYKDKMETFITNEILMASAKTQKDKKVKLGNKTSEMAKSLLEQEWSYQKAVESYNDFLTHYYSDIEKILEMYQEHQKDRLARQEENIIKMLIFETSMMKNFQYDILTITNQVEKAKTRDDIKEFIERNQTGREKLRAKSSVVEKDMLAASLYNITNRVFEKRVDLQMSKELKTYFDKRFKGEEVKCALFEDEKNKEVNRMLEIVSQGWSGEKMKPEELVQLRQFFMSPDNRVIVFRHYQQHQLTFNVTLTQSGYEQTLLIFIELLGICLGENDAFVAHKMVDLAFVFYYLREEQKWYLHCGLNECKILSNMDYWKASVFQSIQQELYRHGGDDLQELEMREMSLVLGQLAMYCHQMILLGVSSKSVRQIIGWFCRLYGIPDDHNRDLAKTVTISSKKYKQLFGANETVSVQSNPRDERERKEMIEGIEEKQQHESKQQSPKEPDTQNPQQVEKEQKGQEKSG